MNQQRLSTLLCIAVWAISVPIVCQQALAQPDPSGIDFVRVGAAGNPAYAGPDVNRAVTGRGSVPYEFQIGRTEVTTAQWMEFYNAFYGRVVLSTPVIWGATATGNPDQPFRLLNEPDAANRPVVGQDWRTSALFVNWLCNDKRTDLDAVRSGAYDVSTFGYEGSVFTDQLTHTPGARYWIPSLDEWIKAVYYDPNYGGSGVGGWWWRSTNGSNTPLVLGPPGIGEANEGFDLPDDGQYRIPLGAYPQTASPWGVLDAAGATREMTESVWVVDGVRYRYVNGSYWTYNPAIRARDEVYAVGGIFPSEHSVTYGLRVAGMVPSVSSAGVILGGVGLAGCGRRRRGVRGA